jgi:hypothetical protein
VTKDNQRQGMADLLAKQRSGLPLTPSEAARQRRSHRGQSPPAPAVADSSQDLPSAEEDREKEQQAAARSAQHAIPGQLRRGLSRVASYKSALLAAACAVAVPLACWLAANRWQKRGAPPALPRRRFRLPDQAARDKERILRGGWPQTARGLRWYRR